MSGKRYPEEFKKQVVERGHSISNVAKRLDVTTHSLYAWVKKYGPDSKQHNELNDAQAEIRRLQKELKRTTEERDLLKKPRHTSQSSPTEVCLYQRALGQLARSLVMQNVGCSPQRLLCLVQQASLEASQSQSTPNRID